MFDFFRRKKTPPPVVAKRPQALIGDTVQELRAKYDAIAITESNAIRWSNADALSPNLSNSAFVRHKLRRSARYERANNSYLAGLVETVAADTVSTGPKLRVISEDGERAKTLENLWLDWSEEINLPSLLRTARKAKMVDGECFFVMRTNRANKIASLDLALYEADQFTDGGQTDGSLLYDGVEFDASGNRIFYWMLKNHPGDGYANSGSPADYYRIPASHVIHYYRTDRPGQIRGVPEVTPAIPLFAQLRDYTLAVIGAAQTAASFAAVLANKGGMPSPSNGSFDAFDKLILERGTATILPPGYELGQITAQQPCTTYAAFKNEILKEIARCLCVPACVAQGDSSGYNYASGRLDYQVYHREITVERREIDILILNRVFQDFFTELVIRRSIDFFDFNWEFGWPGFEHVDPGKEASAAKTNLGILNTTLSDLWGAKGENWRDKIKQCAAEKQFCEANGIDYYALILAISGGSKPSPNAGSNAADTDTDTDTETETEPKLQKAG